jgi:hypothetical protein
LYELKSCFADPGSSVVFFKALSKISFLKVFFLSFPQLSHATGQWISSGRKKQTGRGWDTVKPIVRKRQEENELFTG